MYDASGRSWVATMTPAVVPRMGTAPCPTLSPRRRRGRSRESGAGRLWLFVPTAAANVAASSLRNSRRSCSVQRLPPGTSSIHESAFRSCQSKHALDRHHLADNGTANWWPTSPEIRALPSAPRRFRETPARRQHPGGARDRGERVAPMRSVLTPRPRRRALAAGVAAVDLRLERAPSIALATSPARPRRFLWTRMLAISKGVPLDGWAAAAFHLRCRVSESPAADAMVWQSMSWASLVRRAGRPVDRLDKSRP